MEKTSDIKAKFLTQSGRVFPKLRDEGDGREVMREKWWGQEERTGFECQSASK